MTGRSKEETAGVSLLGNQNVRYPDDYAPEVLETFVNKHPGNDFFVKFNFVATQCLGLGKEYSNLVLIQKELATFVETRYAYEFVDISNDEIKRWNEEQAEAFRKHPELAQLLTEFQQTQGK